MEAHKNYNSIQKIKFKFDTSLSSFIINEDYLHNYPDNKNTIYTLLDKIIDSNDEIIKILNEYKNYVKKNNVIGFHYTNEFDQKYNAIKKLFIMYGNSILCFFNKYKKSKNNIAINNLGHILDDIIKSHNNVFEEISHLYVNTNIEPVFTNIPIAKILYILNETYLYDTNDSNYVENNIKIDGEIKDINVKIEKNNNEIYDYLNNEINQLKIKNISLEKKINNLENKHNDMLLPLINANNELIKIIDKITNKN